MLVRNHPGPWPLELAFTRSLQHLPSWPWLPTAIDFFGTFGNPTPSGITIGIVFAVILLLGWYRQAIFLTLAVGIGDFIDTLIGEVISLLVPGPPQPSFTSMSFSSTIAFPPGTSATS